jgi:hypothetical protein
MTLPHVLSHSGDGTFNLEHYNADQLKKAARFWIGVEAHKLRKAECVEALHKLFRNGSATSAALANASKAQQQVLSIFARYGPAVSGAVLSAELHARGLVQEPDPSQRYYGRRDDIVNDLRDKFVLIRSSNAYDYYSSSLYAHRYPDLMVHPALATTLPPVTPLPWQPSAESPTVQSSYHRSATAVALDLWQVATGLQALGTWQTVKGGALARGSRNRLRKGVPLISADQDRLAPPDPESLYYEILRGMRCLSPAEAPYQVLAEALAQHVQQLPDVQAWHWVRAWLDMRLWQDGIGVVPDRDNDHDPVRIDPSSLRKARELLLWALCRVAHSPDMWLDVETFGRDLWQATHRDEINFYWGNYTWPMPMEMARRRDSFPAGEERLLAFWLADEGVWVANAVMVTLVTLGLVERGQAAGKQSRPCFRLTALGRAVFGAPEGRLSLPAQTQPCLTVQPNLEVLAYLDQAAASDICTLARFTTHTTIADSQVQTFTLQRAAVYQALESGMTLADIEAFLRTHSRTDLPANVARTLAEWAGKRESLVLRTQVTLACGSGVEPGNHGRLLQDGIVILPHMSRTQAAKNYPRWTLLDHRGELSRACTVTELGDIRTRSTDSIVQARLSYLAERAPRGWQVTATSMTRARQYGFSTDQMLGWLRLHLSHALPPVLEMAMRNWTGQASVFAGPVQLLHVPRPQARDAMLQSPLFAALLAGHIPPDWFVVRHDKAAEVARLLTQLGFSISDVCPLSALTKLSEG